MAEVPRSGLDGRRDVPPGALLDPAADPRAGSRLGLSVGRLSRDVVVVTAAGEVDMATADALRVTMTESLADMSDGCIAVLDLSQVTFLDSSGLQALVEAHRHARPRGAVWRLCGLRPSVDQVIRLTRLDDVFPVHADLAQALTGRVSG
jgi:anti-sigma B factor antagonist